MSDLKVSRESGAMILRIALTLLKTFTAGKTKTGLYLTAIAIAIAKMYGIDVPQMDLSGAPLAAQAAGIAGSLVMIIGVGHDLFKKVRTGIKGIRDEIKI